MLNKNKQQQRGLGEDKSKFLNSIPNLKQRQIKKKKKVTHCNYNQQAWFLSPATIVISNFPCHKNLRRMHKQQNIINSQGRELWEMNRKEQPHSN